MVREIARAGLESLQVWQAHGNKPFEADSWSQLARIHLRLGDLDAAERHAHETREIHEALGLKEAWRDYLPGELRTWLAELAEGIRGG